LPQGRTKNLFYAYINNTQQLGTNLFVSLGCFQVASILVLAKQIQRKQSKNLAIGLLIASLTATVILLSWSFFTIPGVFRCFVQGEEEDCWDEYVYIDMGDAGLFCFLSVILVSANIYLWRAFKEFMKQKLPQK